MTSAEKRTILEAAIARAYTAIAETSGAEMKDERFGDLLFNINTLEHLAIKHDGTEDDCHEPNDDVGEPNSFPGHPDAGTTKESLGVPSETPATEPEENEKGRTSETGDGNTGRPAGRDSKPELEKEPEKPGSEKPEVETFKPAEVRAALASARLKGVNVAELLRKFGAGNFSALPESRYADVMQAVKQELADAA